MAAQLAEKLSGLVAAVQDADKGQISNARKMDNLVALDTHLATHNVEDDAMSDSIVG